MKLSAQELTRIGLFTALHVVAATVLRYGGEALLPFSPTPFFVMLAAGLLGRKGAWSMMLYALLGLVGFPVFAQAPYGGIAYLLKPSAGFIFGYVLNAYITARLLGRGRGAATTLKRLLFAGVGGLVGLYAVGLPYLYLVTRFVVGHELSGQRLLQVGFYPFIAFDLAKVGLAASLTLAIRSRLTDILS